MAKKKTSSLLGLILMAVGIVGAVLAVIGVFTDWVSYSVESIIGGGSTPATLKELADTNDTFLSWAAVWRCSAR